MLRRVLVLGLLGPFALMSGCSSVQPGGPTPLDAPGAGASLTLGQTATDKTAMSKRVTLSVSGMI